MGWLLETAKYSARKLCVTSDPSFQYSAMAAETMTGAAYWCVAVMLFLLQRKRPGLIPSTSALIFFQLVFFTCGLGHVLDVVVWEKPVYNLWLCSRWATGLISFMAVLALPRIYRQLSKFRSRAEYHKMANDLQVAYNKLSLIHQKTLKRNELLEREVEIMDTRIEHLRFRDKISTEVESLILQLERIRKAGTEL